MQVAGQRCLGCSETILLQSEGTWCARCKSPAHPRCVTAGGGHCARCNAPFSRAEDYFVYSKQCSACGIPNTARTPKCKGCGYSAQWDTVAEYEDFKIKCRMNSHRYIIHGFISLALGALVLVACGLALVLSLRTGGFLVTGVAPGVVACGLIWTGVGRIRLGRRMERFE